ncbi:MAG: UDP-glucuronic acid decarboxylase family protein [Acidaminococcaceae bacterium]
MGRIIVKKILVTGGAGFIGSNLCRTLLQANPANQVICLDNFFTGSKQNIEQLLNNEKFKLLEHDVIDPLPADFVVDEIYNLACPASPLHYQKDPVYTTKTSVLGIINMLDLAKQSNAKLLQTSTSEVYGEPEVHPQVENYRGNVNPIGIRSCYDEGKRCAESLIFDYHRMYGVKIKVIRIFNTYGPHMDPCDGRVISNFIMQALHGKDITIYGDGSQTRSFCYVDDLLNGMLNMMASEDSLTGPVNIGNPQEISMLALAEKVINIAGSNSNLIFAELPLDDPARRRPVIELAQKTIKWEPTIMLEEGLRRTISYFRSLK